MIMSGLIKSISSYENGLKTVVFLEGCIMGWYYDFYKVYKTKKEDAEMWDGKSVDELPDHL